jgi:IS5 family transposase
LYSLHEPHVVCITKGKARQRHEFGAKVSVVTTANEGLVLDCQALSGNPYNSHTEQHRRNRIGPIIGHMKSEGLLDRCHLQGELAELLLGRKKLTHWSLWLALLTTFQENGIN